MYWIKYKLSSSNCILAKIKVYNFSKAHMRVYRVPISLEAPSRVIIADATVLPVLRVHGPHMRPWSTLHGIVPVNTPKADKLWPSGTCAAASRKAQWQQRMAALQGLDCAHKYQIVRLPGQLLTTWFWHK